MTSLEAATNWVKEEIQKLNLDAPVDVFVEDMHGTFKGMVFAKFSSIQARDEVVEGFKTISISKEHPQWVKPDLPVNVRAP